MKLQTIAILMLPVLGYAAGKSQFQLEVVKAVQTENAHAYYVPGTPSQSSTNCTGTATDNGSSTSLNADCTTTNTPGRTAHSGTRYTYSEDMRVIMPDGSHLLLWCQEGYRTCLHLSPGRYWAERDKDRVWIYSTYADQEHWNETGMSPGQRKANHRMERVKYRVVGIWKDDTEPPPVSEHKSAGLDPGLAAFSDFNAALQSGDNSLHSLARQMGNLGPSETICSTEIVFGEVFVCKTDDPHTFVATVATRPLSEIHRHWLEEISRSYVEFKRLSLLNCKDTCGKVADFVNDGEKAAHEEGSVWLKLKTAYCNEVRSGTYPDVAGQLRHCGD